MSVTIKIIEWILLLKSKPQLIIANKDIDYFILKNYVEGYFDGIGCALEIDIRKNITYWFQNKINQPSSLYWTDQILNYYSNKTDKELQFFLLEITEEYFKKNPNWYIV